MQIGARLLFGFMTVILVMMLGTAATVAYLDFKVTRDEAQKRVDTAMKRMAFDEKSDFNAILNMNQELAQAVVKDQSVMSAVASGDRSAVGARLKDFLAKTSFAGIITFIDKNENVFYSTDTPTQPKYSVAGNPVLPGVFTRQVGFKGGAQLTATQVVTLSVVLPYPEGKPLQGAIAVSSPMDAEFLSGVAEKLAISSDHIANIDITVLNSKGAIVAMTAPLAGSNNGFIRDIEQKGLSALPQPNNWPDWVPGHSGNEGFERADRWWKVMFLKDDAEKSTVATVLLSAPLPAMMGRLTIVAILALIFGALGIAVALIFIASISRDVNDPLRFLIRRTSQIGTQRAALPPLEGLTGDWLELGEQIDTAVTGLRATVQHLRVQVKRVEQDTTDQNRDNDETNTQLDQMNKQFSVQSKQLNELSRQLNATSRQAVLLQHKMDSVLQVSTEGYLVLDQYGNVLSANPVFLNWVGATEADIAGKLCFDLVKRPGEPPNSVQDGQAFARHGGDPHALINQFYPDGVVYHRYEQRAIEVMAHLQPVMVEDGSIQGYVMVLRDKSLRSEIAQLRSEIVTMLTESVRAPLSAAETTWSSVLHNAAQTMHPSVGQSLAELHAHYEQMIGVVDSLLMMYGGFVPPPAAPREQIVITRLVADCLEEVATQARTYQLALDYRSSPLPTVSLNRDAVRSTLINVLQRMISLTAPGGRVRVETVLKGSELRIGVQSSGPALSESEIGDLFAGFIEGKHDESTYSTRLSMYLARNTVERFGGKIWAESEAGRGTIVYFTVPVQVLS